MDGSVADRLKRARKEHPDAIFTIFTLSGHVLSGKITASDGVIRLEAGRESAEVTEDRIEAFSFRLP